MIGPLSQSAIDALVENARALIFDCDGTLVDTQPVYARAWAAGFGASGAHMDPGWYKARTGMSEHVLLEAFERDHDIILPREEVVRVMRATFIAGLDQLREIKAIAEIARRCGHRLPMAVASGGPREIVLPSLQSTGLAPLFDAIVTIEDVKRAKPEPDLFLAAAERLRVSPADCLVFEDSREGLAAARRAKMRVLGVLSISPD